MHVWRLIAATAALGLFGVSNAAVAQHAHTGGSMPSMMHDMRNLGPAQKELMQAMHRMDEAMMKGMMDPDPGKAWMKSMAAHHQGAIDMSVIIQRHSKNRQVLVEARKTEAENRKSLRELRAKMR